MISEKEWTQLKEVVDEFRKYNICIRVSCNYNYGFTIDMNKSDDEIAIAAFNMYKSIVADSKNTFIHRKIALLHLKAKLKEGKRDWRAQQFSKSLDAKIESNGYNLTTSPRRISIMKEDKKKKKRDEKAEEKRLKQEAKLQRKKTSKTIDKIDDRDIFDRLKDEAIASLKVKS